MHSQPNTLSPLPPIREGSFLSSEIDSLKTELLEPDTYDLLVLHKVRKALLVGGFIIGAKGSRHSPSFLVLARCSVGIHSSQLAEIHYFACCVAVSKSDRREILSVWVATVSWLMEHQYGFGRPTKVWSISTYPGLGFVPASDIILELYIPSQLLILVAFWERRLFL